MLQNNRENFRAVSGYDNYEISDHGRVRNVKTGRILKYSIDSHGYRKVNLCLNGKQKNQRIHRLLAQAFLDNPHEYNCVDHIDRNRTNNHISNLRWVTYQMNNCNRTPIGSVNFTGVCFDKKENMYRAAVRENNGKRIQKAYSINKYGKDFALLLAKTWREEQTRKYKHYL